MTRPYTITAQPVVTGPKAGMAKWVDLAVKHSGGSLWNNGVWQNRDVKGKPGVISNHARGLAVDLSYRYMFYPSLQKHLGRKDGRKTAMAYLTKLLENADTLAIALVIDYQLNRSWKCDRGTWKPGQFYSGDWFHVEVDCRLADNPQATKRAFDAVFGVSPTQPAQPV